MSIPKVIHYCWYGYAAKPEYFERCYASWKKYAPEYEIVERNESNTNIQAHPFMKKAYESKKWAFVSDIARLQVVYDHGGIYLDTDVELRAPLDNLLEYSAFFFYDVNGNINTGLGFAAEKGNALVKAVIDDYRYHEFSLDVYKSLACPALNTQAICSFFPAFECINKTKIINQHAFISSFEYARYALHLFCFSWKSDDDRKSDRYKKKKIRFFKIRRILRAPCVFEFFRTQRLFRIDKIYRFFVYDLIDNGALYYVYRLVQKIKGKLIGSRCG